MSQTSQICVTFRGAGRAAAERKSRAGGAGSGCRFSVRARAETVWGQRPNLASPRQTQTRDKKREAGNAARASRNKAMENKQHGGRERRSLCCRRGRGGSKEGEGGAEVSREEGEKWTKEGKMGTRGPDKGRREEIEEGRGQEGECEGQEGHSQPQGQNEHLVPHKHPARDTTDSF